MKGIMTAVVFLIISPLVELGLCYDNNKTHPEITKGAVDVSGIDQYSKDYLGEPAGVSITYGGKPILKLLQIGSTNEDAGWLSDTIPVRAAHHFYNPLKEG